MFLIFSVMRLVYVCGYQTITSLKVILLYWAGSEFLKYWLNLRYGNTSNKNRATCLATLLQNELNSDDARFTTHIKPLLQQIRLSAGLNMGGKTRNIAIRYCCSFFRTFKCDKTTEMIVAKIKIFGQMAGYWPSSQNKRTRPIGSYLTIVVLHPIVSVEKKLHINNFFYVEFIKF